MKKILILMFCSSLVYSQNSNQCITPQKITKNLTVNTSGFDEACVEIDLDEGFETADNIDYTAMIGNTGNGEASGPIIPLKFNDPSAQISLIAYAKGNQVWLRWTPLNHTHWYNASKIGYRVLRSKKVGSSWETPVVITTLPIPKNDIQWEYSADSLKILLHEATYDIIDFGQPGAADDLFFQYFAANTAYNQRFDLAISSGHGLKDSGVLPNETYRYTIESILSSSQTISSGTALEILNEASGVLPQSAVLLTKENSQQKPKINISFQAGNLRSYFSSYDYYRAAGMGPFSKLNQKPIVYNGVSRNLDGTQNQINDLALADTLPNISQTYHYKIVGRSYFGEFKDFNVKSITVKKNYLFEPSIDSVFKVSNTAKGIKWKIDSYTNQTSFNDEFSSTGWSIWVNNNSNEEGYVLLSSGITNTSRVFNFSKTLLASKIDTTKSHYFQLRITSTEGDVLRSKAFFVLPTFNSPPAKPSGLVLKYQDFPAENKRVVTLTWLANSELDLEGYKVTRRIGLTDSLVVISGIRYRKPQANSSVVVPILDATSLVCEDILALNVTYPNIYYGLCSIDNFNNESDSSQVVLPSIDNIRPFPPSIKKGVSILNVSNTPSSVELHINYSPELSARHVIYRSNPVEIGSEPSSNITFPPSGITQLNSSQRVSPYVVNQGLIPNKSYFFSIIAIDQAGNTSCLSEINPDLPNEECMQIVRVDYVGSNLPKENVIDVFKGKTSLGVNQIELEWSVFPAYTDEIKEFEIYKSEYAPNSTQAPKESLYKVLKGNLRSFNDLEVISNTVNQYFIRAILKKGQISQFKDFSPIIIP